MASEARARDPFALQVACGCASLLALAVAFAVWGIPRWIPPAPVTLAGVPLPTTGLTRSIVAFLSGDPVASLGFHPLGPLVLAALAAGAVASGVTLRTGSTPGWALRVVRSRRFWVGVCASFLVTWGARLLTA